MQEHASVQAEADAIAAQLDALEDDALASRVWIRLIGRGAQALRGTKLGKRAERWYWDKASRDFVSLLPSAVQKKIPSPWGAGEVVKKKIGWRWADPSNKGNNIRIDMGNPMSNSVSQRVDHVVVTRNGQMIGRNGQPIQAAKPSQTADAHIPLSEWEKWATWFSP